MVRPLLIALLLLLAAAAPPTVGPVMECRDGRAVRCGVADIEAIRLTRPGTLLARAIEIDPAALPLERPLMVWVVALASSEVRWNGIVIGRNGQPGETRASEVPGRFFSTFTVPATLVRPGRNIVSVHLSAHHLWLPVRTPVHIFEVAPYESTDLPGLRYYLPALLALGALLAALAYFGMAAMGDRRVRGGALLAAIAAAASLQLVIEVSRVFILYSYPWHLARVSAIAAVAAVTAFLLVRYAALRFGRRWRWLTPLTLSALAAGLVIPPYFDAKALVVIVIGAAGVALCALPGLRRREPEAVTGTAVALLFPAVLAVTDAGFLDGPYYFLTAGLLIGLAMEQVLEHRRTRRERDSERQRAAALAERLARAEREGEPILALKDGSRIHRVAEGDVLYLRADDDYCEVTLRDGRRLLVTMTLGRLLASLPARFVRVHRSWAVNRAHVTAMTPRPAGGRALTMSDGSIVPAGRNYGNAVLA